MTGDSRMKPGTIDRVRARRIDPADPRSLSLSPLPPAPFLLSVKMPCRGSATPRSQMDGRLGVHLQRNVAASLLLPLANDGADIRGPRADWEKQRILACAAAAAASSLPLSGAGRKHARRMGGQCVVSWCVCYRRAGPATEFPWLASLLWPWVDPRSADDCRCARSRSRRSSLVLFHNCIAPPFSCDESDAMCRCVLL